MNWAKMAAASLLFIVLVALGARTLFAWSQIRLIPNAAIATVPFQNETGHIAYSLASGKGFASPFERDTGPTAWLAPVYPALLAGIFRTFGIYTRASFLAAISLNILFSCATCIPIFHAGRRVAGLGVASLAAWLWALLPNAIMMPFEWIWDTSLSALLAAIILWATVEVAESQRLRDWCLYGLLWGLALMTNPALASVLPFLLVWLVYRKRQAGRARAFARPALAAGIALLCCMPWTVRNYLIFHRFVPVRSNFGFELYIGNNENYDERRRNLPATITKEREELRYLRMGEMPFMDEEKRKAVDFIRSHPRVELELFAKRCVDFWVGTAIPIQTFRESGSLLIRVILLGNFLSFAGAVIGIGVLIRNRSSYACPFAIFIIAFPMLYYVTHTSLRYRHPVDPIALLLTAISAHALMHSVSWKRVEAD
jgi:hypothetical protein